MSRKSKVGLDYFPHNCSYDDELKYIIAKHKEPGYYIYFETLKRIYNEFGYYMKSNNKSLVLHSGEINVDIESLNVIINDCLGEHLFNNGIHKKHNILTSKGIQERYFEAIKRRNSVDVIKDYILVDYVNILGQNVNINFLNADKSTQSKVKKSKVNKRIKYAEFVFMTEKEFETLETKHGLDKLKKMIEVLDNYKGSKGKIYKSDYRAILSWVVDKVSSMKTSDAYSFTSKKVEEDVPKASKKEIKSFLKGLNLDDSFKMPDKKLNKALSEKEIVKEAEKRRSK